MSKFFDHKEERDARTRVMYMQNSGASNIEIDKLADKIGDREIAAKIIYIAKFGNVKKSELLDRYKSLSLLLSKLGYKQDKIIAYVKKNKNILYVDKDTVYENYTLISDIFIKNNKKLSELVEFIDSVSGNRSILLASKGNILGMINLITKIFESKGFSREELYKYLYENKSILSVNPRLLKERLAILSDIGLDETLIFEKPYLIHSMHSVKSINNAIKCLKEKNLEVTLESIDSYASSVMDNKEELTHDLPDKLLELLTRKYDALLAQNSRKNCNQKL